MRFSLIQEKEIIEAANGRFLGYVIDAEISQETGLIIAFIIEEPKKLLTLRQTENLRKKILLKDIVVIGKDVILVKNEAIDS